MSSQIVTSTSTASTMVRPFGEYSNLGVKYEGESAQELLNKTKLNWGVKLAPITYEINGEYYPTKDNKMIVREDKPSVNFGPCGSRWTPLQNEGVLSSMLKFVDESEGKLTLERVGSFKQGKSIWALASSNNEFELPGGDKVTGNILLINHHTVGKGLQVKLLTWRQVCSNGLTLPVYIKNQVLAHTANLTNTRVNDILNQTFETFGDFEVNAELLSKNSLSLKKVYTFVISNFGRIDKLNLADPTKSDLDEQPKAVKQIINLYLGEAKGSELISSYNTNWGLLNAITQWEQYESPQRGGEEGHINSLWLGSKAQKNQQVFKQLVSLSSRHFTLW